MKAVVFHKHGGPEQLVYQEVPDPELSSREVLIRVKACGLNHLDLWVLQGIPAYPITFPHILGSEISGVVEKRGEGVASCKKGDEVLVIPLLTCGTCSFCVSGKENRCVAYGIIGAKTHGGYAELVKVPAQNVFPKPPDLSFEEAAAFSLTFLTAWHMLVTRAGLKTGETCVVLAAGSGIGVAAVQIAKWLGARVIATAGSDTKLAQAKKLGADILVNHEKENFMEVAKRETSGQGVDVVFEHVGPATWEKSVKSLAKGGRLVTCGATTGPKVELDLRYLYSRELTLLGSLMGTRSEFSTLLPFVAEKKLRPIIDTTFPLRDAAKAHERMHHRSHFGKILIIP